MSDQLNSHAYVCIMAGGSGERFWPMSRPSTPKHLLKLFSDRTLIEETVRRTEGVVPPENIFVLTNEVQVAAMREALPFMKPEQIIAEPAKRDTAPAAALATGYVKARDPEGVLALLPADALIKDAETFARQLQQGLEVAAKGESLLTFAIKPTHPATGFGYLEMAETRDDGLRRVARFVEKPDQPTAEKYLASGNYGWNAGIFLWNVAAFEREAESNAPELVKFIRDFPSGDCTAYLAERFSTLPKISVDYAIMEKASSVATMVAEFDWDDVGSWAALPAHMAQDEQGNTAKGNIVAYESSNNIAISSGRVIALCGVKDLVVVETADSIMVCHRDAVQDIKKLMADLPPEVK